MEVKIGSLTARGSQIKLQWRVYKIDNQHRCLLFVEREGFTTEPRRWIQSYTEASLSTKLSCSPARHGIIFLSHEMLKHRKRISTETDNKLHEESHPKIPVHSVHSASVVKNIPRRQRNKSVNGGTALNPKYSP